MIEGCKISKNAYGGAVHSKLFQYIE